MEVMTSCEPGEFYPAKYDLMLVALVYGNERNFINSCLVHVVSHDYHMN